MKMRVATIPTLHRMTTAQSRATAIIVHHPLSSRPDIECPHYIMGLHHWQV
jgi:hypothetical protein